MRVLLDNCTPRGIAAALKRHEVVECRSQGWDQLKNGELLNAAEAAGFEVFVTADQGIPHQQNLTRRKIAIVVLATAAWDRIRPHLDRVSAAVEDAQPGAIAEILFPEA